ncbi:MAG TPA: 5-formyltetrahydrofolate cyclo-ligase [Micromonosporaceae bacterium]|jgi:5-formyltetrahydrofolate cyclo-ligase|nr:5-formyltetrahydrofolate cyclo-ligase [Micromonosporaceae bacterium]
MIGEPKRDLRLRVLDARRATSETERAEHDRLLCDEVARWLDAGPDAGRLTVAGYAPMPNEPGGASLPAVLAAHAGRLLLPVWQPDNDLEWADYRGLLTPGRRGPHEPDGPPLGVHAITEAAVVIAPALAVDRHGMRLGRGGGSYDRALARLGDAAIVVALLYPGEILSEPVPTEPHDRPVHGVIDPTGVHWFAAM